MLSYVLLCYVRCCYFVIDIQYVLYIKYIDGGISHDGLLRSACRFFCVVLTDGPFSPAPITDATPGVWGKKGGGTDPARAWGRAVPGADE